MTAPWHVLTARVPDAVDDEIASVLGEGSLGVDVAPSGPGWSAVRVYVGSAGEAQGLRERALSVLSAHGLGARDAELSVAPVADERWVEHWQETLAPIPLGERFVVLPTAGSLAPAGREGIRLIPGMAFGTGEHATTRMCAAAVEAEAARGSRWLDLGTGTGVLAVVASRCGAARVLALDVDPQAVEVACGVVRANGVDGVVEARTGTLDDAAGEPFDGIVANIQSSFFLAHAGGLARALAGGGVLVASGFLDEDVEEISAALARAGLRVEACRLEGPWACLRARRDRT